MTAKDESAGVVSEIRRALKEAEAAARMPGLVSSEFLCQAAKCIAYMHCLEIVLKQQEDKSHDSEG